GDWEQPIQKILLSVDITKAVVEYASRNNFDLVISHHPLFLNRHSPNSAPYKIETTFLALRNKLALMNAHTNADVVNPGVSDAIADLIGLQDVAPLVPLERDSRFGIGRVGILPEGIVLSDLAKEISQHLNDTSVRFAGDASLEVRKVAIVGGSGDSFMATASAAGAHVYVTSDIRHHPLQEHLEAGGCAVIEINHALAESLWLSGLATRLEGFEVEISKVNTLGWN
ncbi:MAG: hypothetical protein RL038_634, partial [Actinomycetota bacterium]